VCHHSIVTAEVAFAQPADVQKKLIDQPGVAPLLKSGGVTRITSKELVGA
jgi:hypothetical protein